MNNFDFLKKDEQFASFADAAIAAENVLHIDFESCVTNCRRALEFAVKWMYSVDRELDTPYDHTLASLMNDRKFKEIVGKDIWRGMDYIRKLGNIAIHETKEITEEQAELCLEHLYYFLDEVAYFYAQDYTERPFDRSLLALTPQEALSFVSVPEGDIDLEALIEENRALKEELTARRAEQQRKLYVRKLSELPDYRSERFHIDLMQEENACADAWEDDREWPEDDGPAEVADESDAS